MMKRLIGTYGIGLLTMACLLSLGCISNAVKNDKSSSLLASTKGFEKDDLKFLKAEHFQLNCAVQGQKPISVKALRVTEKIMEFPGETLKDGMTCFLEVRGPLDPKMSYTWLGQDKDGKPVSGLYYMSEEAEIKAGKLILPIVKLYTVKASDSFSVSLLTNFSGADALSDADATNPTAISAELVCAEGKHRSLPATKVTGQDRLRTFAFNDLSVSKLKSETCDEVKVYQGNNTLIYRSGKITPAIVFVAAQVGQVLNFQVSVNPYVAPKPAPKRVDPQVQCLEKDAKGLCKKFSLPREKNLWVAEVSVLDSATGTSSIYFVTGPNGLEDDTTRVVDTAALNTELLTGNISSFEVYNQTAKDVLLNRDVNAPDSSLALLKANFSGQSVQFIHFVNVYIHGFHKVDPNTQKLNITEAATENWIAVVDVLSGTEVAAQFLIAGADNYFASNRMADGKLFTWDAFVKEKKSNTGFTFTAFAYADALRGASGIACATPLTQFLDDPSMVHPQPIRDGHDVSEYQYCEITTFPAVYLEGHTIKADLYVYGWNKM